MIANRMTRLLLAIVLTLAAALPIVGCETQQVDEPGQRSDFKQKAPSEKAKYRSGVR